MEDGNKQTSYAELLLSSKDLTADMDFFIKIGFRLDNIFPSDDPSVARMSGLGLKIRIDKSVKTAPPEINILTDYPESISQGQDELIAPNGTIVHLLPKTYALEIPKTQHHFEIRKLQDNDPWIIGRAGMLYRDLIPARLGGSIIASHIRIPNGGPVPDMVHYHTIGFQLIFCYKGWVKLVYEDQGPPFILNAGDCVTQPPEIRHRVLEASDNLEVIEIGVPAEHMTTIDHNLELPTKIYDPNRSFKGHKFCHHKVKNAEWKPWRIPGFKFRETGINRSTNGIASVQIAKTDIIDVQDIITSHDCDILFTFVMEGKMLLKADGSDIKDLKAGDAFVIPPGLEYKMMERSQNLELLEVSLPGDFKTFITAIN
jgi:quercetin dioxygenase-like cupin family protein